MSDFNCNNGAMVDKEKMKEKERLKKRTLERMMAGAREEQKKYDEKQKFLKELRQQLKVFFDFTLLIF